MNPAPEIRRLVRAQIVQAASMAVCRTLPGLEESPRGAFLRDVTPFGTRHFGFRAEKKVALAALKCIQFCGVMNKNPASTPSVPPLGAAIKVSAAVILAQLCGTGIGISADADAGIAFFESKVRPILVEHCYDCHSGDKTKGGLALDSKAGWQKGGDNGPAIVPGNPAGSLFMKAVEYEDADLAMPPKKKGGKLSDGNLLVLSEWIKLGAPDPRDSVPKIGGMKADEAKSWWAFQPLPKTNALPAGASAQIDAFLNAGFQTAGLQASPPADKRTLLRRASYDLTGLPPSAQEVDAFLADASPDAFSKVVERLLASPQYGVKWGRHWLDVVRYTDFLDARTAGKPDAGDIVDSWRYRDWVVSALNNDLPYDQFVSHQIAGDLLARGDWDPQKLIATSVYAIGNWGNGDADKEKVHTDIVDDQIDLTSRAFLGLTLSCARCHDHKFDPLTNRDYYALAGIFFSSSILESFTPKGAGEKLMRIPIVSGEEEQKLKLARQSVREIDARLNEKLEPFTEVEAQVGGNPGLSVWKGRSAPHPMLVINASDSSAGMATWKLPAKSIAVHPGQKLPATISWRSPVSGKVKCAFELKDADPNCGDGIVWVLRHGEKTLATEPMNNATTSEPREFSEEVQKGDLLQLIIRPRAEYTCDMTQVALKIEDASGKIWDVAEALINGAKQGEKDLWWIGAGEGSSLGKDTPEGKALAASRQKAAEELEKFTFTQGLREGGISKTRYEGFHDAAIHKRGRYDTLGETVPRGFPALLTKQQPSLGKSASGRLELARWITSPENPLTARVFVNRVWQHHFGEGIVRSSNNFGKLGTPPTHPELLDWLAAEFIRSGWRIKDLHRLILHSAAYQRSSTPEPAAREKDPDNRFFSHQNRHRLSAEELRDSLLRFAEKLDPKLGGKAEVDIQNPRRTLYLRTIRSDRSTFQALFDGADPASIVEKRVEATVAPQSLFLLNHP
ncbi:MAG: DUF1549 domain-containing protein, partial [Verrucomicrobia bacterium]|nr:DUF1549 domain-containing protein [Verrucomicrobiota bacterium]